MRSDISVSKNCGSVGDNSSQSAGLRVGVFFLTDPSEVLFGEERLDLVDIPESKLNMNFTYIEIQVPL
jgi:hypothetical protein